MSTISNNPDKNKISSVSQIKNQGSLERYKLSRGPRQSSPLRKRSNDKIIDELSSFIAEFSYLSNGPHNISQIEGSKPPIKSYQAYPTHTAGNDGVPFNSTLAYDNKNSQKVKFNHTAVEWKDNERLFQPHYKNQRSYQVNQEITDSTKTSSAEEKPKRSNYKRHKNKSSSRRHHHPRKHRSRDSIKSYKSRSQSRTHSPKKRKSKTRVKRKQSRQRSPSKKRSPIGQLHFKRRRSTPNQRRQRSRHSSYKRSHYKPKRSRSDVTDVPTRHRRPRSRSSKSLVRYWPFRYEKKKTGRRVIKKHRKSIPVISKLGIKEFIPSESATLITLYPGLHPKQQRITQFDPEFLVNPALPCKCFDCMRKYKSLVKLPYPKPKVKEIHQLNHSKLPGIRRINPPQSPVDHGEKDTYHPVTCTHKNRIGKSPTQHVPEWFWYPNDITYMDDYYPSPESDQATERSYKSVHLNFNCYGHDIDSTILKYFHSILSESMYCQ